MSLVGFTLLGSIEAPTLTGAATGVPLLVKPNTEFTAAMLLNLDVGGGDLRFSSDAAGLNQLPCEVVDGLDVVWVKPTGVSISTGATLYVWGDNTGASQPAASSTYGSEAVWSDETAAWHLNTGTSESSLNGDVNYNITEVGTINQDTSNYKIAPASDDFNETGHFTVPNDPFAGKSGFAIRGWINFSNVASDGILGAYYGSSDMSVLVFTSGTGNENLFARVSNNAGVVVTLSTTSIIGTTGWRRWSFRYDGATVYLDIDGVNVATDVLTGLVGSSTKPFKIGTYDFSGNTQNRQFPGNQQSILIGDYTAIDQISIEYDNQSEPNAWWIASDVGGGISITESVVNSNYASLDPAILLTGSISVTESLVNANYAAINPIVTLTGSISITESIVNANYTSLNPVIDLTGIVSVAESLVNSNYISLDPVINLTSGAIEIIESTAGTQYAVFNPSILLTPEPLGIVSTVCFNGELVDLNYSGQSGILEFSGQLETAIFNGEFNALDFSGTIQTTCADGDIKTNC